MLCSVIFFARSAEHACKPGTGLILSYRRSANPFGRLQLHWVNSDLSDDRRPFCSLQCHEIPEALRVKDKRLGALLDEEGAYLRIVHRVHHRGIELVDHGLVRVRWRQQSKPGITLVV